jgi:hypothetical protein
MSSVFEPSLNPAIVMLDKSVDCKFLSFILCVIASLTLLVFRHFERWSWLAIFLIHATLCIIMMVSWVWIGSFMTEPHPDAYRDAVRTVFIIYPVIIAGGLLIDGVRTAKANRILKKHGIS